LKFGEGWMQAIAMIFGQRGRLEGGI